MPRISDISAKQEKEINYWRDSEDESPESDSIYNTVNKLSDAPVLLDCLTRHRKQLDTKQRVLELGAGQGWAACIYKKLFPRAHVTVSDISEYAVKSLPKWERLFGVTIDNSYACKSYEIRENDASLDLIFCFAAAHHFVAHKRTLLEISRVLKPRGTAIYFQEPATPRYLYPLAYWRVNRKRPAVPEDVLIVSELEKLADQAGLDLRVDYYPQLIKRSPFEMLYYFFLSRIPILQRVLPCSANFVFTKS